MSMSAILASLLLMLFSISHAFASEDVELSPKQKQSLGIATASLPPKSSGELAGVPAQVVIPANQLFVVSTPLPAMVEQTLVDVGDRVRKGQPLAHLQSPALAEAQRGYLQASTQEQLAKGTLNRDEQLWKEGIIAESRLFSARSLYIEASAALAEKRHMLLLAGMTTDKIAGLKSGENLGSILTIRSPIDGVILEKSVSAGQRLESATPLFNVARLQPLGLEMQLPLASSHVIRMGAVVRIPAYSAQGKITAIGQSLSDSNQTILLRALINKGTKNLRAGQFVEVSIATSFSSRTQWNVPNTALARIGGKVIIFVETTKGFHAVSVIVLHEGEKSTLLTAKLGGDEKIAIHGVSTLKASLMGIGGGE
jgi:cobalt-zinc-cadmium efflux system membrane fusion protein